MRFDSFKSAILAMFVTLFTMEQGHAARIGDPSAGFWIYSKLEFNELEGEYNGLQVGIVPYDGGISVLWRSANGNFDKPLLLNAQQQGHTLTVTVPTNNQLSGTWTLEVQENFIAAKGPRDLHFTMSRLWTR